MKKLTTLFFALSIFFVSASAQQIHKGDPGMWPAVIKYDNMPPSFKRSEIKMIDAQGKPAILNNGRIIQVEKDALGFEHYRYQQYLHGIAIEHATLVVHVSNGKIKQQNGKWIKDLPGNLLLRPSINEGSALAAALKAVGAKTYKWEMPAEEAFLKREQKDQHATFYPKATLLYYSGERDVLPSALRLAYKFDVYAQDPVSRQLVFVDAGNGRILGKRELIHETNTTGTAHTAFSGTQNITSDYTGTTYRLRETGRGNGINTYNLQTGTSYSAAVDFTDADNNWYNVNAAKDEYATDAHWATEKTYDYFFQKFNRNSIDNAGMALNSYLHYSTGYFNAFWDGSRMTYGDGDAAHGNTPLTSLDVCGHEITHGITERTSGLVYAYESGAMNEGFSDIFGTAIEAFARPGNTDWLIGGDFFTIRSMSNPNAFNQPDTYEGNFWYSGSGDNGGVHYNSGVLNHWFYLLTVGGSGVNDHGTNYQVIGIGMDKAAAIAYRLNTYYLVSTSDYYAARTLGIQAAEDLYGEGSNEAMQTGNAWTAVGLYAPSCDTVTMLPPSAVLDVSATLNWQASIGAVYYDVDIKWYAASEWVAAGTPTDTSIHIAGLVASTVYDWRIRSSCNGNFSYGQFTTADPICNAPGGLVVNPGNTSATLSWNPALYAVNYTVEYKEQSASVWQNAGSTSATSLELTGLAITTTYDWRVRTNCSFGNSSFAQHQFRTTTLSCTSPGGLNTTYNAGNITTMAWNPVGNAVNYYWQIKWQGDPWENYVLDETLSNTSHSLTGLMSGLTLDWRVRTNCDSNYSVYAVSQLTTPCPTPLSISTSGITASSATVSWTMPAFNSIFGFTVQYKLSTSPTWISTSATTSMSKVLAGLAAGKVYDVRVRLNCYSINSGYVQTQFATPCNVAPTGLTHSNVATTKATVKWTGVPGAISYNLQYKKSTVGSWTTVPGIATNSYNLVNLTANTVYNYQVQMVCTAGTTSYSSPASFTTYCVSSGTNNQEWIDYFKFGTMERNSGADAGGYFNASTTFNPLNVTIGANGIAGIISAAYSGQVRNGYYAVYIDYNRNGNFTDAGEKVAGQTAITNANNYSFWVNIPATASPGITAMRVVLLRQPTAVAPCLTGNRGETEDYYVNLVTAPAFTGTQPPAYVKQDKEPRQEIIVAPNPSAGLFTLTLPEGETVAAYEIFFANGSAATRRTIKSTVKQLSINITHLPNGMYILKLLNSTGNTHVLRLIKQ